MKLSVTNRRRIGTLRVTIGGWAAAAAMLGALVWAGDGAKPLSAVPVTEAWRAVAGELRSRGVEEGQLPRVEDIEVPVAVPGREGRRLHVSSLCWDSDSKRARFRLECDEAGACLPFFAYMRSFALTHARAASCQIISVAPRAVSSPSLVSEPLVRAGEHVTAVLEAAGLRITASVTCLDRGARGEVIRVRGQEGGIFHARVAGPAVVEALLPARTLE